MDVVTRDLPKTETAEPVRRRRGRRWLMALLCLLALAAIGYMIWFWPAKSSNPAARAHLRPDSIPVLATAAERRNVPIYLDGLGTVQASSTVTVRAVVDGPLIEVRFKEGQMVHKGEVLAQIDPRPFQATLDQTVGKKAQDSANLANARVDLARYQKLAATAYSSAQVADTQKATVAQLEAQVAQDQAQIDSARTQLGYTTITSPIDGRAGIRQVDAGNIVHASDATGIVVITTLQPISVIFTLPQQNLPAVAAAMKDGHPETLAMAQGASGVGVGGGKASGILDRGELSVLDNQVDPTTGTIKLKAVFPNEDLKLWPGGFVGVRLKVATEQGAIVVPPAAVQRGPSGTYVYVVADDMSVSRRAVTVGHEDSETSIVTSGLKPGEKVVTDGASRLNEGSHVTIVASSNDAGSAGPTPAAAPGTRRGRDRGQ